ncbi:MAG: glycosyltransferase [Microthrixaceae bacterium]
MAAATRSALRRADTIWASSEPYLEWGVHQSGRARRPADTVIPHGYDVPDVSPTRSVREGPLQMVFAGALTDWLDFDTVTQALARLNERTLRAQLTICGSGEQAPHLRQVAETREDITVVGFLDRAGLWDVFSRSDIGIAPYVASNVYDDSLPNKIIEYCAAGLVVATSIRGRARGLLAEHGAGFGYDNSDELCARLEQLSADRAQVAETCRNAATLFEAKFVASQVYGNAAQRIESLRRLT